MEQGVLLYGPPGTGKTLLAKAIASNMDANFLKVVSSAIVDKYIGESARLIREMFGYAKVRLRYRPVLVQVQSATLRNAHADDRVHEVRHVDQETPSTSCSYAQLFD